MAAQIQEASLVPELEAIAQIADQRLRIEVEHIASEHEHVESTDTALELRQAFVQAASAALAAGLPLGAVADAEQIGRARSRRELGGELLRRVERTARRHREAQAEYQQTVARADRLGLSHREISTAAQIAPGTVRAIAARSGEGPASSGKAEPSNGAQPHDDDGDEHAGH